MRRPSSAIRRRIEQAQEKKYLKEGAAAPSPHAKLGALKGAAPAMGGVLGVKHDPLLQKARNTESLQTPSSKGNEFNKRRALGEAGEDEDDGDMADAEDISRRLPFTTEATTPSKALDTLEKRPGDDRGVMSPVLEQSCAAEVTPPPPEATPPPAAPTAPAA